MKKLLTAALAVVLALSFASCSGKKASKVEGVTMRLLTDKTGIDDKSFNAAAYRGIMEFYGDTWESQSKKGTSYDVVTAETQDMYIPNLKQVSDDKYDLIVTTGFTFADALNTVAPQYPDQKYLIIDIGFLQQPNIMQITFSEHEGAYLVGVAAALKAKADGISKPKFGFIGGIPGNTITKFEVGYAQGILSVIPDAQILDYYVGDWGKPELAKAQAKLWYDSGVYAIFSAAGGSGNGTIAQAKESRSQGKNVWAIGVDSDQYEDGLYAEGKSAVLTSMLKSVETATRLALERVRDGTFKAESIVLDTKSNGVGFSSKNPELGAEITAKVEEIRTKIVSGEIKVVPSYASAKALPGFPQNFLAKDE